ncbi:MAG TPA: TonB family protein [Bryobacteraceae bacterium]
MLREAIARLNSSGAEIPDQTQVADLLAATRDALERAKAIARAVSQCDELAAGRQFDQALAALDQGLSAYPADPVLLSRRTEVEKQRKEFHTATAVQAGLQETQWFLDQNRPDLAVQFLKDAAAALPDQAALILRLQETEALLSAWELERRCRDAMARAAALEQLEQWQGALTILEEALVATPEADELMEAAVRVRSRLESHERKARLARRVEAIGQKIAAQSWKQALTLLDKAEREWPGEPELGPLRMQAEAGLRASECEAIIAEVRQCLADGDPEQAEEALLRGLESLGEEPSLAALLEELEADKKYREEMRAAQILFGRCQFSEAEQILGRLAVQDRGEAQALLDAVRQARTARDEESFCERGREKALKLMQERQYTQAADLLRNLLSLFPGDAILERELAAAEAELARTAAAAPAPPAVEKDEPVALPEAPVRPRIPVVTTQRQASSRVRRAAIAGTASLALVSASGAVWRLSRSPAEAARPATALPAAATAPAPAASTPPAQEAAAVPTSQAEAGQDKSAARPAPGAHTEAAHWPKRQPEPAKPLRPFVPPPSKQASAQPAGSGLPLPPGSAVVVSSAAIPALPADFSRANVPAPPPQPPAPATVSEPKPSIPVGGKFEGPQLTVRILPDYPLLARQRGLLGEVRVEATVDERGEVVSAKVLSGDPILATSAKNAILKWKYKPATLNGQAIAAKTVVQVQFGERR